MVTRVLRIAAALGLAVALLTLFAITVPALAAPHTSPLDVVISEIAWMGTTTSSADEWIELYNNTSSPIDVTGWTLSADDGTPSITLSGTIPASSYWLLERTDDSTVPGVPADDTYSGSMECSPCLNLGFEYDCKALPDGTSMCMKEIPVESVLSACEQQLQRRLLSPSSSSSVSTFC